MATILGRTEKFDALNASLINGLSSHALDFNDTHLRTIIHPTRPVAPALLAISGISRFPAKTCSRRSSSESKPNAESAMPLPRALRYRLTHKQGLPALSVRLPQSAVFSDCQSNKWSGRSESRRFSRSDASIPAARRETGLRQPCFASKNFTSSEHGIEAKNGWANVLSTARKYHEITDNRGRSYEIRFNTYKPFACGIVSRPIIDGCLQLRDKNALSANQIARTHRQNNPSHRTRGEVQHLSCSGRCARGRRCGRESVFRSGRFQIFIQHAVGSAQNPMTDRQLEQKFEGLASRVLPPDKVQRLIELCWGIESLPDAGELPRLAAA